MLTRQCGHRYALGRSLAHPRLWHHPLSVWISDAVLQRTLGDFLRRYSRTAIACERFELPHNRTDRAPKILLERDDRALPGQAPEEGEEQAVSKGQEAKRSPTSSEPISRLAGAAVDGKHDVRSSPEDSSSSDAWSVSNVSTTPYPGNIYARPPPPGPIAAARGPPRTVFRDLEQKLAQDGQSARLIVQEYHKLKKQKPTDRLTREALIRLAEILCLLGRYRNLLEIWDRERIPAVDVVIILKVAFKNLGISVKKKTLSSLVHTCYLIGRHRLAGMVKSKNQEILAYGGTAVLSRPVSDYSREVVERMLRRATTVEDIREFVSILTDRKYKMDVALSRLLFERLAMMDPVTTRDLVELATNPAVIASGSNNIASICRMLFERGQQKEGYQLVISALENSSAFSLLSDEDIQEGIRAASESKELVALWEALKASNGLRPQDLSAKTLGDFLTQAQGLDFDCDPRWGSECPPLLQICAGIVARAPEEKQNALRVPIIDLVKTMFFKWVDQKKENKESKRERVSKFATFLNSLPADILEFSALNIVHPPGSQDTHDRTRWPQRNIWSLVHAFSETKLCSNENSPVIWHLESLVIRNRLLKPYLETRDDAYIARFALRHYATPYFGIVDEQDRGTLPLEVQAALSRLQASRPAGWMKRNMFAEAVIAVSETLAAHEFLVDLAHMLNYIDRRQEILPLLKALAPHRIYLPATSPAHTLVTHIFSRLPRTAHKRLLVDFKTSYAKKDSHSKPALLASYAIATAYRHPFLSKFAYDKLKAVGHCHDGILVELAKRWSASRALHPLKIYEWLSDLHKTARATGVSLQQQSYIHGVVRTFQKRFKILESPPEGSIGGVQSLESPGSSQDFSDSPRHRRPPVRRVTDYEPSSAEELEKGVWAMLSHEAATRRLEPTAVDTRVARLLRTSGVVRPDASWDDSNMQYELYRDLDEH